MRLGLSSFVFRYAVGAPVGEPMDAFTLLRRAYAYGLDAVQFSDNLPLHLMGESEHAALRNLAGDLGVGIEVGTRGMDHQLLRSYVALAAFYGSHALRLVLDEPDSGRAESELRWLLPLLEEHRLPLAIENHGEMPAAELEALVQRIGHPLLGFCVDTANNLVLLERPMETMAPLAGRATQLHLKDYVVQRSPVGYRITGCPLGEGALDLRATIRLIRPLEREMDVFLECWMDPAHRGLRHCSRRSAGSPGAWRAPRPCLAARQKMTLSWILAVIPPDHEAFGCLVAEADATAVATYSIATVSHAGDPDTMEPFALIRCTTNLPRRRYI